MLLTFRMENLPNSDKHVQDTKFLNALAEAFRLQEAIINTTELCIASTTPEGVINSFNSAAEKLLGYSAHELIDKASLLIFFDLEQAINRAEAISTELKISSEPVFDALTAKARESGQIDRSEWVMIRKDGSRFPALVAMTALREDSGVQNGYVIIITDITNQKQIDERAAINEQKFRLLAENIPGTIYLCHNDGNYSMIYLNDRVSEITGYTADEFLSGAVNFTELFHPDDSKRVVSTVDEALNQRQSFHLKYRLRHRSGEWRWVDEVGVGVYSEDKLLMIEGFISDITTQMMAEEKLKKVADENLRVFNNPVNLNAVVGFDGYFKRLSDSWPQTLGWTKKELKSEPYIHFVHPDDVEATKEASSYIMAGNNLFTFENRYRCKDGSYRWLLWGSAYDLASNLIYSSAVDITERKKSEEALLQSKKTLEAIAVKLQEQNRQLDEFAHVISHNMRSPVNNIQALIGLLDENSAISDYKLIFDKLRNVSKNLSDTMKDLMDTIKVRTNINIDRVELRFKDVLDKVVQSLEGDLIMAEASVTFDFNEAPLVTYPKAYLESIFQNLLSNALKYHSPERKPVIHFTTKAVDGSVELRVSDNGLGIDLVKVGDKLFGLHRTFHEHSEARGVGLFLTRTQVQAMGGSIRAESTVGQGTTFIIRFGPE